MNILKVCVIAIGVIAGATVGWMNPAPAKCAYCPSYQCFSSCGGSCLCMRGPGSGGGQCVSFSRVEEYSSHGYTLMSE